MKAYNFESNAGSKKGKVVTFAFHIIIAGFLTFPFLLKPEIIEEEFSTVILNFVSGAGHEGAKAEIVEKVSKPITIPETENKPVKTSESPEPVSIPEVKENGVEREEIPVESKTGEVAETERGTGDAGSGDAEKGDRASSAGDGIFEGIGNLERKIIYRPNLKQLASREGVVSFMVCVNRAGAVTDVVFDPSFTTITDKKIINEALNLASEFRFENKYTGPAIECGRLQVKITHAF